MKKTILIATALIVLSCTSKKEDVKTPDCQSKNTYTLRFVNTSSNVYMIYVNNAYVCDIAGKKEYTTNCQAGYTKITCTQKTGYILYPTIKEYESNVQCCQSYRLMFP
ncbi:MAG: hypothetical protein QM751_13035 [Paludibacteraceae bacterium]